MPASKVSEPGVRRAVAIGESAGPAPASSSGTSGLGGSGGGDDGGIDDLQARLDNLRRD